jgi:hypothetical protein
VAFFRTPPSDLNIHMKQAIGASGYSPSPPPLNSILSPSPPNSIFSPLPQAGNNQGDTADKKSEEQKSTSYGSTSTA